MFRLNFASDFLFRFNRNVKIKKRDGRTFWLVVLKRTVTVYRSDDSAVVGVPAAVAVLDVPVLFATGSTLQFLDFLQLLVSLLA